MARRKSAGAQPDEANLTQKQEAFALAFFTPQRLTDAPMM